MQTKGGSGLKIASIVLAIWGVIAFIVNIKEFFDYKTIFELAGGVTMFSVILLIAATAVMIVARLLGFLNSGNPSKAGLCMTVAIIALAMIWIATIMMIATYGSSVVNWAFVFIGTALCAWYIFSAKKLGA